MAKADHAYEELAGLLTDAAEVIDSVRELNIYCSFDTPVEFNRCVRELAVRVRIREYAALRDLIPIFAPTGAWDDAIGFSGVDLANRIMELLDLLEWNA